jgi:predicted Rossmann-fold nucleotide-binding protein
LFGRAFWESIINWDALADAGTISEDDLALFKFVETAEEAVEALETWEGAGEKRGVIPGR